MSRRRALKDSDLGLKVDLIKSSFLSEYFAAVRKKIQVVARGGAAGEHEFRRGHLRTDINSLGREFRPDRVKCFEPLEQITVLRRRNGARQRLVEMVMRVDETRKNDVPVAQIEHFIRGCWQCSGDADLFDYVIAHQHRGIADFLPCRVHRDQGVDIFNEQCAHGTSR